VDRIAAAPAANDRNGMYTGATIEPAGGQEPAKSGWSAMTGREARPSLRPYFRGMATTNGFFAFCQGPDDTIVARPRLFNPGQRVVVPACSVLVRHIPAAYDTSPIACELALAEPIGPFITEPIE
jgi:hypothetical protein